MSNSERLRDLYSQCVGAGCVVTHPDYPGKVLAVKLGANSRGYEGLLSLPAGHREEGETPQETITREVYEETGFENLQFDYLIGVYRGSNSGEIGVILKGTVFGSPNFQTNDEVVELIWEEPSILLDNAQKLRSTTRRALVEYAKGNKLPLDELEERLEGFLREA